jgi:hypothetical protein
MTKNIWSLSWHYNKIWLYFPLISLDFSRFTDDNTRGYQAVNCDLHMWNTYKLQIRISWRVQECNILRFIFVYSVITCKYTTQTRHYGSYHVTMNTNFFPKLRNIFGAESLHCYTICKMNLMASLFHLIAKWCNFICCYVFGLLYYTCLKVKSFITNKCSGSHTRQKVACEDKE